jgi:hypothetical protein
MKTVDQIKDEAEAKRTELAGYCRGCTDEQVRNVLTIETDRAKRCSDPFSEVGAVAQVFAEEAQKEIDRRSSAH